MSAAEKVTALVRVEPSRAIEPANMGELTTLAAAAGKSGFFGAKTPEQALLVMMCGRDLGLSYSQSLRAFHVIEGKPTLSADGMVAACLVRRDVCEYFRTVEASDALATVETKRVGDPARRYTFALDDAKRAGLVGKANWQKYPSRMLLARARSALARDVYADLLLGLYDPDEIETPRREEPAREELQGEVVETDAGAIAKAGLSDDFRVQLEKVGRGGTIRELRAIGVAIAKAGLPTASRDMLRDVAAMAKAAIEARAAMPSTPDAAEPAAREPGEEG